MAKSCTVQKKPSYEVRDIAYTEPPLALTDYQAEKQAENLLLAFLEKPAPTSSLMTNRCNRPDAVRKELLKYLRSGFGYHEDFKHPTVDEVFPNALVHQRLYELKEYFSIRPSYGKARVIGYASKENGVVTTRNSFLNYLKLEFPTGLPWRHPLSGRMYSNSEIRETLKHYELAFDGVSALHYKSLWCLFTTQASRAFIAANFEFRDNSVLRLWHDAVDGLMLLLEYGNLNPEGGRYRSEYRALWCLISTRATRSQASEFFNLSDSSIKRLWNDLIDPLLLLLAYPELEVEKAMTMYKNRG